MSLNSPKSIFKSDSYLGYMCCHGRGYSIIDENNRQKNLNIYDCNGTIIKKKPLTGRILGIGNIGETSAIYLLTSDGFGKWIIQIIHSNSENEWKRIIHTYYSVRQNPLTKKTKIAFHESSNQIIRLITISKDNQIYERTIPWLSKRLFWPMPTETDDVNVFSPDRGFSYSAKGKIYRIDPKGCFIDNKPIQFYKIFPFNPYYALITHTNILTLKTEVNIIDSECKIIRTFHLPSFEPYSYSSTNDNNYLLVNIVSITNRSRLILISNDFSIKTIKLDRFVHRAIFLPEENKIIMHNNKTIFELENY